MPKRKETSLLAVGRWEIDRTYGLEVLAQYLADREAIKAGTTTAKALYKARREASKPRVLQPTEGSLAGGPALRSGALETGSIAHMLLSGPMQMDSGLCSAGVRSFAEDLAAADANPNIAGIVLELRSGGGESQAGSELQNAISDITRRGETKIVVYTQMMASAALRGTLTADAIYAASNSSMIGSIGTYFSIDEETLEELEDSIVIYAEQSSLKNIEERGLAEGDIKPLQELATRMAQAFIDEVQEHRLLRGSSSQVAEVLAGKTFIASEALQLGLVDGIATFGQVLDHLATLINNSNQGQQSPANSTTATMSKFKDLIVGLKEKLGIEVPAEASYDDIVAALDNAPSLTEVRESITTEAAEGRTEITTQIDELKGLVKDATTSFANLQKETATTISGLQKELATLKGERIDDGEEDGKPAPKKNSGAPDASKFKTVESHRTGTGIKSEF